jgi:nitrate/nitrite-specific signal transduction histidine kinase
VLVASLDPGATFPALAVLWVASTLIFVLFGQHLVRRAVLRPLAALSAQADRLAAGETSSPPPALETRELAHLATRFQAMA